MSLTDKNLPDAFDEIDLGGRNRGKILIALVALVLVIGAAVVTWRIASGDDETGAANGSHFGNDFQIAYQASSASEKAFLDYLDKEIAPKHGVTITPVGIEDGNQLDQATADGKYIANIYQHKHWLKQVTDSTGWDLKALGPVFQWSYSIYSEKYDSFDKLPKGATIALLNDPANTAQALWILERAGAITFKDGVDPAEATEQDIATNPKRLKFQYIEYGAGPRSLPSVDAVIDYNMSFVDAGTPDSERILAPAAPKDFAGQLVVGGKYLDDPQVKVLKEIFFDPAVQEYLKTNDDPALKGQLAPVSAS
ncbi:MetQ/NlpA family ABC transporter substrate-binding protein [Nocardioides jiangxiensis]|uniref:MetQ/NlpA family ABC transporter substrate-binding protein n=1 Tax=Nocardioides jiangxiensis TaxID=3064524 RepID=A0ABT9B6K0_9ACTN|nr:MetQ/NlpA family ABC transporter substrate-binding protein [Nocardioides sp. WY-20]MDO7868758.1 MetQ/NlpA family ABC transporter substrate-binding protein [Nocardioides sp. WY-20]